ncbi:ferredoxin reductase family protein [Nonomuraea sp. SYSU D8015]|uniref:ferredoxin reductase family protein n=1 Tax=Nonomuraea sp. SYSU D8015 TaxID=2593644 RepID=UPI0016614E2C|nr:ferredoxin reductase family protein [Nonomuraea sp. SYSU D8015]
MAELFATTAVILFAAALVLATRARFLEPYFGGLDRMYAAHRRTGRAGFVLLTAHVVTIPWTLGSPGGTPSGLIAYAGITLLAILTIGPLSYGIWRRSHRLIGVFFAISLAHTLLVDQVTRTATVPFAILIGAYVVGIAAFLHTTLLARFTRPRFAYEVRTVRRLTPATVEITLRPRKERRLGFVSGQFVFVTFHQHGLREPHPFTISSAPAEQDIRLTIKASGDYTSRLSSTLRAGCRATVEGGYGMLDYRTGGRRQLWIAGGIGITPFLSWLRDMPDGNDRQITLFYTVRHADEVLYWEEIRAHADTHPGLRVHLNVSSTSGTLTTAQVLEACGRGFLTDVYMCGPLPMLESFERGFRAAGLPSSAIHFELFSFR